MQAIAIKRLITAHRIWTVGIVGFMLSTLIVVSAITLTREGTVERNETVADQPVTMISEMAQADRATQIEQRRASAVTLSAAAQADLATMGRYYAHKEDRLEEDEQHRSSLAQRAAAEQRQLEMERQDYEEFLRRHSIDETTSMDGDPISSCFPAQSFEDWVYWPGHPGLLIPPSTEFTSCFKHSPRSSTPPRS